MLRLAADENFNSDIIRGVRRRNPAVDIVTVQDEGLSGSTDAEILEWAAQSRRVLLTHDVSTMTRHAYDRVRDGKPMPGVFEVTRAAPLRAVIEDILLLVDCSLENEWEAQVRYLPLQ